MSRPALLASRRGGVEPTAAPGLSFEDLSGLQFLGDPAQISGVTVDGTAVASWTDLSGNGRHAVQATGGNQPLFKTGIFGSLPSVRFDGTDDFLKTASFATITQPFTIVVVYKPIAHPGGTAGVVGEGGGGYTAMLENNSALMVLYAGGYLADDHFMGLGEPRIIRAVFNGASSQIAIDGELTSETTGDPGAGSMAGGLALGYWGGSVGSPNADYGHVIVWDGSQLAEVEAELSDLYGIAIT